MLHDDRIRASSFGEDPEQYDRSRPTYPPELIDALLVDGARTVVDVGVGTGIVARLLLTRGCSVLGIEPDVRMAELAVRSGIEVESSTFEEWSARGRMFDLVSSGQAWHWVKPDEGATKAAAVLRPGGRIGTFWNQGLIPEPVKEQLRGIYRRLSPGLDEYSITLGNLDDGRFAVTAAALRRTGAFEEPEIRSFLWRRRYTTEEWIDQLPTHSDHRGLPRDLLVELLEEVAQVLRQAGGGFDMTYRTWLVTARRKG